MRKIAIVAFVFCMSLFAINANAQIETPRPSPTQTTSVKIGLTDVMLEYSRPGMKDRKVFSADGLVPYGEVWRTGANYATKLSFSADVKLGDAELKAGEYAILTKPTEKSWEFMFYPYESTNFGSYVEKEPVATTTADVVQLPMSIETFMISIDDIRTAGATISFLWETTMVSLPLAVEVDAIVEKAIAKTLGGPAQGDYYTAASYYHDAGKDLKQALAWIKKANAEEPKFWMVRREALIRADMKDYRGAISSAKLSKKLAEEAEYESYIRMNEQSIKEWTAKLGKEAIKGKMPNKEAKMK